MAEGPGGLRAASLLQGRCGLALGLVATLAGAARQTTVEERTVGVRVEEVRD